MHPQLQEVVGDFAAALARLHRLVGATTAEEWQRRPAAGGWSAAECVAHLNLTSEAFVPLLRDGLERAEAVGEPAPRRFRRDLLGWAIWRASRPGGGMRSKTAPAFVPPAGRDREAQVADFERLQEEQIACVRRGDGLPLDRVKIASPFDGRVRYSLYSAFTILPAHQHRHLAQAERAAAIATADPRPT